MGSAHDEALGRVIRAFTRMELTATQLAWMMISPQGEVGFTITNGMPTARLLTLMSELAPVRYRPNDAEELRGIIARAQVLTRERNKMVHSAWGELLGGDEDVLFRYEGRLGSITNATQFSPAEIAALAVNIDVVNREIQLFLGREPRAWVAEEPAAPFE